MWTLIVFLAFQKVAHQYFFFFVSRPWSHYKKHEYWNLIPLFNFYMLLQVDLSDHDYVSIALITGHGIGEGKDLYVHNCTYMFCTIITKSVRTILS